MKRILCLLCMLFLLSACATAAEENKPMDTALAFMGEMALEKNDEAFGRFSPEMALALPRAQFDEIWPQMQMLCGDFEGIGATEQLSGETLFQFEIRMLFSRMDALAMVVIDPDDLVSGLFISPTPRLRGEAAQPSATVYEEDMNFGEPYVLPGTLTLPQDQKEGPLPAVVFVHGSGPSDRDETIGPAKPFRDMAHALANAGIASLRYDKRTFAYGGELMTQDLSAFTVWDETVEDAILAVKRLRQDPRIDPDRIFLVGHSMGAMLAPRIQAQGAEANGLIMLAGSPRELWELMRDQNLDVLATMPKAEQEQARLLLQEEEKMAMAIEKADAQEAAAMAAFGMPGYYLWEMAQYDAISLAKEAEVPLLFLQGEKDIQVYFDVDFAAWKQALEAAPHTTFISYPELGHLFTKNDQAQVDEKPLEDMIAWILEQ